MCDPPIIHPSLPEYTPLLFNNYNIMRPSQNLPLPPRIYPPPFQQIDMCDPLRIYSSLPEYTPLFNELIFATLAESTHPPRIYPLFNKCICATLPASTPPFQNLPHFSTIMCDPPRIYPCLPECTPLLTTKCDHSRIYPSLLEYTPTFQQLYYLATFPEYIHPSQNIPPFQQLCATLPEIAPLFDNFFTLLLTKAWLAYRSDTRGIYNMHYCIRSLNNCFLIGTSIRNGLSKLGRGGGFDANLNIKLETTVTFQVTVKFGRTF